MERIFLIAVIMLLSMSTVACGNGDGGSNNSNERSAFDYVPVGDTIKENECGNGIVETYVVNNSRIQEQCDDGNFDDTDACPNDCDAIITGVVK